MVLYTDIRIIYRFLAFTFLWHLFLSSVDFYLSLHARTNLNLICNMEVISLGKILLGKIVYSEHIHRQIRIYKLCYLTFCPLIELLCANTRSKSTVNTLDQYPSVFSIGVYFSNLKQAFKHLNVYKQIIRWESLDFSKLTLKHA